MFKLHDRVKETSYTQGTGNLILREAVAGFRTFSSVYSDQDSFFYCVTNDSNYEIGVGRYVSANNEIERVEVLDSTTDALINWGQGVKEIYVTYTAKRAVSVDPRSALPSSGNLSVWSGPNELQDSPVSINSEGALRADFANFDFIQGQTIIMDQDGANIIWGSGDAERLQTEAAVEIALDENTSIDELLEASGYTNHALGLKKQSPATIFAGPLNDCGTPPCDPDYPSFRPIVAGDIPVLEANKISYSPTTPTDWDTVPTQVRSALDTLAKDSERYLQRENNLSDITNPAIARANLGVELAGTDNSTNVTLIGENYLELDGQQISAKKIDVVNNLSGIIPFSNLPIKDEGDLASNSQAHVPTQQSVKTYVDGSVADLVNSAPGALDTLKELSDALGGDENFATTVASGLGEKLSKSSNLSDLTDIEAARANLGVGVSGEANWGSIFGDLSSQTDLQTILNGKEPSFTKNSGFNKEIGTLTGTVAAGDDARFSDARTPIAHNHDDRYYTETECNTLFAGASHDHDGRYYTETEIDSMIANVNNGNLPITRFNSGTDASSSRFWRGDGTWQQVGSGVSALWGQINGTLSDQSDLQAELDTKEDAFTKATGFNKNFGTTSSTVCRGNDFRLTNARTPTAHTHDDRYYTESEVDSLIAGASTGSVNNLNPIDVGRNNNITGNSTGSVIGLSNTSVSTVCHSIGYLNYTDGNFSFAIGMGNYCNASRSMALGYNARVTKDDVVELTQANNPGARESAVRLSDGKAAISIKNTSVAPSDGGSTIGDEDAIDLPREMYAFRRSGNTVFIDVNIGGTVRTLQLGTVT